MTTLHLLILIGTALLGNIFREWGAVSKRAKGPKFSWKYYWENNKAVIVYNLLGVIILLACSGGIFYLESMALKKGGIEDIDTAMRALLAPTGIAIGFFGAALVRKLLKKGAERAGIEDVYNQVEESVEVGPDSVKTVKKETTITTPSAPPAQPAPPPTDG